MMKRLLFSALTLCLLAIPGAPAAPSRLTVLELFTSEGCSSCPSADELLNRMTSRPDVLALAFHVDYWNSLGWPDPYSRSEWSARQRWYSGRLRSTVYTPQLVVDGREEFVGSDNSRLQDALSDSQARSSPVHVTVEARKVGTGVEARYQLSGPWQGQQIQLALIENNQVSEVKRGENAGRTLRHEAVVLELVSAEAAAGGQARLSSKLGTPAAVVAFVQDPHSGAISGAARAGL